MDYYSLTDPKGIALMADHNKQFVHKVTRRSGAGPESLPTKDQHPNH